MEVTLEQRIELEQQIVRKIFDDAIAQGFHCRVYDGGEWACPRSQDTNELMEAIMSTDEDVINFYKPSIKTEGKWRNFGAVNLVYGNSAYEVMSDSTDNDIIAAILAGAETLANDIEAKYYS